MPSLLDMTDVPMTNILEKCDFKSVLTLRKVCHDLRNFIDDANFETDLDIINIEFRREHYRASKGNMDRCATSLTSKSSDTYDSERTTPDDLKILLNLQNSKLYSFNVSYREMVDSPGRGEICRRESLFENPGTLDDLERILKNKTRPLKTEHVEIEVWRGSDVLKVFPHLDSKVLKSIRIECTAYPSRPPKLEEIGTIMELDQFKNASELTIDGFPVDADLKKFFHFEYISVRFEKIPFEDLVALKEAFTTFPHMKCFVLILNYRMDRVQFEREFGAPAEFGSLFRTWYLKIGSSKDYILKISRNTLHLTFERINVDEIGENVMVRD
ncbi:unnamed protein product [Caenorhabditis brenneri]